MSERKRGSVDAIAPGPKRRSITAHTVEKWKRENDKNLNTASWLTYKMADRDHVKSIACSVCTMFNEKLKSMRNYTPAFIDGSVNLRTSSFKDHASSDMHARAMMLLKRKQAVDVHEYSPIARVLSTMDETSKERMKRKFEVAFTIAKNNMALTKMKPICDLEERHGVDLGQGYKNNQACASFVEFIALDQRLSLLDALSRAKFYSFQADGTTDAGNAEDELFLAVYLDYSAADGRIHVVSKFFSVRRPHSGDAKGLFDCLQQAVKYVGLPDDWNKKLVGFGCDGTSVNIADHGLKMYLQETAPWIETFWCLAHRLELSLKDALKGTLFTSVDEMLLRVYFLYEKSPKKCRELETVIEELQACLTRAEFPKKGGHKPLRACGTRFIAHKVAALDRLLDRFGAYLNHLTTLVADPKTKLVDRQRLKGYILQWRDARMLLGSAYFCDILRPSSILCKILQEEDVCVVRAIEAVVKTSKAGDKLKATRFEDLPTVKKVLGRISRSNESGTESMVYQGVQLTHYERALTFCKSKHQASDYITIIQECLRDRVKIQSIDLLTHAITILATQGWEKSEDSSFGYEALQCVSTRFLVPLENANVNCALLNEEWDDIVEYAKRFLNLAKEDYKVIWWKLFNAPDSSKWTNLLTVVELLFCLPVSNGHLERIFSQLKLIKAERRACLGEDRLDQLVRISVEAPPLSKWDASKAVELWWRDKTRRLNISDIRARPRPSSSAQASETDSDDDNGVFTLENWETWLEQSD